MEYNWIFFYCISFKQVFQVVLIWTAPNCAFSLEIPEEAVTVLMAFRVLVRKTALLTPVLLHHLHVDIISGNVSVVQLSVLAEHIYVMVSPIVLMVVMKLELFLAHVVSLILINICTCKSNTDNSLIISMKVSKSIKGYFSIVNTWEVKNSN